MANYTFSATSGSYTALTGATTATLSAGTNDEGTYNSIPIGFTFTYMGRQYTTISASTNGWLTFGQSISSYALSNALATGGTRPLIAPLWDDNDMTSGSFSYKTEGSAPNRVFTAQYSNVEWNYNAASGVISFQVKLYEASGAVEFVYNPEAGTVTSGSASIGIAATATGSGNYLSLNGTGTSPTVSSATETTTLATKPSSGQVYTFTPPATVPLDPSGLSFTSVTISGMTLNWTDNSSDEVAFSILRSDDNGVTYNVVGNVAANTATYAATGLLPGTTYFWEVRALTEGRASGASSGSQATNAASFSGTKSVGPTGDYGTLTAALADINTQGLSGPAILELQTGYVSTSETFPIVFSNFAGLSATNTLTVRPVTGATGLSISSSNTTATISMNAGDYVTIDGRPGGSGSNRELTITNTSASGPAILFINDATNNNIRYCTITGTANTSTSSGVIFFSTTTGTTGNDNNIIEYCDINAFGSAHGIYAAGTTGADNSGVQILNNNIRDFYISSSSTTSTYGLRLGSANTAWTISGNSFYQSASRAYSSTAVIHYMLGISNSSTGNGFVISGNYFGGSGPLATGTYTMTTGQQRLFVMDLTVGTTTATSIQGNLITAIACTTAFTTTGSSGILGMNLSAGSFNVGTVTRNTIGSITATGAINLHITGATGPLFVGINYAATSGTTVIHNNAIGGLLATTTTATAYLSLYPISVSQSGHTLTVSDNIIGSTTVANSVYNNTGGTSTSTYQTRGINLSSTGVITISGNTIANITASGTGTATTLAGIYLSATPSTTGWTITGNTIRNLTNASTSTVSTTILAALSGIAMSGSQNHQVSGNTIHSLVNSAASATVTVSGIYFSGSSSLQSRLEKNFIHSLSTTSTSSSAVVNGIILTGGLHSLRNNMIRLGIDKDGNAITNPNFINGIYKTVGTVGSYFHNSVYIGGTGVGAGTGKSHAFRKTGTSGADSLFNNIFFNARSNASGGGARHYAFAVNQSSGLVSNFNVIFVSGTDGTYGTRDDGSTTNYTTIADLRTGFGTDANSIAYNPNYTNATGSSSLVDLHISNPTVVEATGTNITYVTEDFDGAARSGLTPVDIGADAGNFTPLDVSPPVITYTALSGTSSTSSRTLASVTISDNSGVNVTAGTAPRIYFKRSTDDNVFAGNTDADNGWKYVESTTGSSPFSFTIDYSILFGGGVTAGNIIQYFVVAQDQAATPSVGINSGSFATTPSDVDLAGAFPIGGTINSYSIVGSISGTFTVGASGATYTTIQNAVNDVASKEMTGAVQLNLIDATYAETVTIPAFTGSSATNTLTIKPTGTCAITTTSATAVINMSGSDYVIIDGSSTPGGSTRDLTITNNSTSTNSGVVWVTNNGTNGATNNTFKNLNLSGNASTTTFCGIGTGGSTIGATLGSGNNNNVIDNCIFTGSVYGIYTSGASASSKNTGTQIINNRILSGVGRFGIYVGFEDGVIIRNNQIGGISNSGSVDAFGITLGLNAFASTSATGNEVTNATVTFNTITQVFQSNTYSAAGIAVATATSGTTLIANNMVSGVASNATSGDISAGIFLGGGTGSTTNVYHNSVWMNGAIPGTTAGTQASFALAIVATTPVVDIRNNIFRNTQTPNTSGTTKFYAVGLSYTSTTGNYLNLTSENNILDVASGAAYFVGITGSLSAGTTRLAIADWRTETGRDLLSQQANPQFHTFSNLHVLPTSPASNSGANLTSVVSTDYDGEARSTTPDIGADEFVSSAASVAGSITSPTLSSYTALFALTNSGGVEINPTSYSTGATFTAQYFGSGRTGAVPAGVLNLSPYYWTLSSDASSFNVAIRFYFDQIASSGVSDYSTLRLYRRAGTGNTWTEITAGLTKTATYIEVSGLTSFSEFAFGGDVDNPLPVELVNFQAKVKSRSALLSWETKTEVDNSGFEVERMDKDGDWKKVAFIEGHGTSNSTKYYSFEDKKLSSGKHSYRLKQIDNDGTVSYSEVLDVSIDLPAEFALSQNYPNPFNPSTKVDYQLAADSRVTIELYGITGERVAVLVNQEQEAGYYTMMIDSYTHRMASGIYIYRMIATDAAGKNFVATKKLSLLK
ncbi:MAG: hypothetical protein AMXMBFR49_04350 [Chlorobiota bacterium]